MLETYEWYCGGMKCSLKWKNYMVCKVCKSMQTFNGTCSSSHLG